MSDEVKDTPCRPGIEQALKSYSNKVFFSGLANKSATLAGFGAAAATGLLACNQVEADIQYSGVINNTLNDGQGTAVNLDFVGDAAGANDEVSLFVSGAGASTVRGFALRRSAGINFNFIGAGSSMVYRGGTSTGDASAGANFSVGATGWMGLASANTTFSDPWGVFANEGVDQTGIFGFRFDGVTAGAGTGQMYGWMRLRLRYDDTSNNGTPGANDNLTMTIVDWAYEDGGAAIHFGDMGAIPEPGSAGAIALLALGASGLRRRRKNR